MEVICLNDDALFALTERLFQYIQDKHGNKDEKWISGEEAMHMLRITSKTTLQKLRDEGKIRYSQPEKKMILYDRDSILEYLDKNAMETF